MKSIIATFCFALLASASAEAKPGSVYCNYLKGKQQSLSQKAKALIARASKEKDSYRRGQIVAGVHALQRQQAEVLGRQMKNDCFPPQR